MSDITRELVELKREIIEARNQAIKTDNQVVNLALDVRGFEKRFDGLEKRARYSGLGVNIVVAATVFVAAQGVATLRSKDYEKTIHDLREQAVQGELAAQAAQADLKTRLAELERLREQQIQAGQLAAEVLKNLDARDEVAAAASIEQLQVAHLTALERRLLEQRLGDLRRRASEVAFRTARGLLSAGKIDNAAVELRRVVVLDPDGRFVPPARQQLSSALWTLRRWDEAETVLRRLLDSNPEPDVAEESRYLLASALAHQGRREGAKTIFDEIVARGGKYERQSRSYLAALQGGGELPDSPPVDVGERRAANAAVDTTDRPTVAAH